MGRSVTAGWGIRLAVLGGLLLAVSGCASTNYLVPVANRHLPRNMSGYQESIETQSRTLTSTLNQTIKTEETVLANDPGYVNGYIRMAGLFIRAGQTQAAIQTLTRACHLEPQNAAHWLVLGQAEAIYGTSQAASAAYHQALKVNPAQWAAWDGLGFLAISHGALGEAWKDSQAALQTGGPEGPTDDLMGRVLAAQGDPSGALSYYVQAQQVEPNWWQSYYDAARANLVLGNQRTAMKDFSRALQLDPTSGPVWQWKMALSQAEKRVHGTGNHRSGVS